MALDQLTQQLVDETMQTLNAPNTALHIEKEVRISPRRMRALILFSQQRLNVQINGKLVTLIEDSNAPESFTDAVAEASGRPTIPDVQPDLEPSDSTAAHLEMREEFEAWLRSKRS
jgi:hypothetical protein